MTMRLLIGLTCLLVFSIDAQAASEKENWRNSGLTSAIARGMITNDLRCTKSPKEANGCLQGAKALVDRYLPGSTWIIANQAPAQTIRSFGKIHIVEVDQPPAIQFEDPNLKKFAESEFLQTYAYVNSILTWTFDELVPDDEDALAASVLLNGFYRTTYDAYTRIEPEQSVNLEFANKNHHYVGIGIMIEPVAAGLAVQLVMPGSPAAQAGIQIGDTIIQVDGTSVRTNGPTAVSNAILGKENSHIFIKALRKNQILNLNTKRQRIVFEKVSTRYIESHDEKIAVIFISTFAGQSTCNDVEQALLSANENGTTGIVLDVRGNPGGLLKEATCVADLLIPKDLTLLRYRDIKPQTFKKLPVVSERDPVTNLPVALLQNEASASASEILGVILQDFRRGGIIGRPSFGKGIVQSMTLWLNEEPFINRRNIFGIDFFHTTSFYESPLGRLIHRSGVQPDFLTPDQKFDVAKESETPGTPELPRDYTAPDMNPIQVGLEACMVDLNPEFADEEVDQHLFLAKKYFWCLKQAG